MVGIYREPRPRFGAGRGPRSVSSPPMREFRLRDDLQRLVLDGYALPLGVERLDAPPPNPGWVVEFVAGEDENPDTYAFQVAVSHERLRALVHELFEMLPGEVLPVVEIGSVDAYRSIDVYVGEGRSSSTTSWRPGTSSSPSCSRRSRSGSA